MRLSLLALCAVAVALCVLAGVDGAGFSKEHAKRFPVPASFNRPAHFPSADALESSSELRALYAGDAQITVHVVPHTHDDVGWLKTVDQYYLGANNSIQHAAVHHILDTVIEQLQRNPDRKFIYVEQAFFQMWWQRQTPEIQAQARTLIQNGQLEFINGGWCMHDEANTHFIDMIDQTTLGHQYLLQQFGVVPKVGWQIDPFGHSSTQASLLSADVGFEALFFGRMDHFDHDNRMANKNMEFIWRASQSQGDNAQVFTGGFQNGNYGPPDNFCFDWFCNDAPMITDDRFIDYNVPSRVQDFLDAINDMASFTLGGKNIMVTMGSDFQYESAREWYENLDALMAAVNADGRITMQYSTPSLYVQAKNLENLTYTVKTDDFFPYSDCDNCYWTGYYVSRPALKRYVRTSSALLQASRQLELLGSGSGLASLPFEQAVGVAQHHDAVAGTSKQHVAFDYAQRLHIAQALAQDNMAAVLANLTQQQGGAQSSEPAFVFCELANISVCAASTDPSATSFQVLLYNSLARVRTELVTIPIGDSSVLVLDQSGAAVQAQVLSVFNVSSHTSDSAQLSLSFQAQVPGIGFRSYFVLPAAAGSTHVFHEARHAHSSKQKRARALAASSTYVSALRTHTLSPGSPDITIANSLVSLSFSGVTGQVSSMADAASGVSSSLGVTYGYYDSYATNGQKSGAYIFRPQSQALNRLYGAPQLLSQTGPLINEVTQILGPQWINTTFRLESGSAFVCVEYTVGEIPILDNVGKEVVISYSTDLASEATWFSDSNGREMQKRVRNYRPTWNFTVTEPISGNYVPMNIASYLSDASSGAQFTVLNDRSQGVVSMEDGTLEIMVHRRTLQDDARGVNEPLNETQWMSPYPDFVRSGPGLIITGTHYLYLGNSSGAAREWRPKAQRVYAPLVAAFAPLVESVPAYIASHVVETSFLGASDLPPNVDLVSMQTWAPWVEGSSVEAPLTNGSAVAMIRLAHMLSVGEDAAWSQPVSVDLDTLFVAPPSAVQAWSLTVNQKLGEDGQQQQQQQPQMKWRVEGEDAAAPTPAGKRSGLSGNIVTLGPMEIKTFVLTF